MKTTRIYRVLTDSTAETLLVRQDYARIGTYRDKQGKQWSELVHNIPNTEEPETNA